MKIILLCAPARSGKDTLYPILEKSLKKQFGGNWKQFAFATKLKDDLKDIIKEKYSVSIWDDSKKHLFRNDLIKYGEEKREETNNRYLVDFFTKYHSPLLNYIITDWRFINEFHDIKEYFGHTAKIYPVYIERVIEHNGLQFVAQPTIPQEIEQYKEIKETARVYQIPWEDGLFWKSKLNKYEFEL